MRLVTLGLALGLLGAGESSMAQSLDELARAVDQAVQSEGKLNAAREAEFQADRNRQRELLAQARQELAGLEQAGSRLKNEYDSNERALAELETALQERMGNLGELFGIVRQAAGELQSTLDDSMVSAQQPGRAEFLADLAQSRELPTVPELRRMWSAMVREIAESGKVVKFNATVERANGEKQELEVARVGVFNAVSSDGFLDWDANRSQRYLIELARQPSGQHTRLAAGLLDADPGETVEMSIDFSRGQILRAMVQSKSVTERFLEDSGPVGFVAVGVGLVGLVLCGWKLIMLFSVGAKIDRQAGNAVPSKSNPLGRVMAVYTDNPEADLETLELKLDEAILRETAPLESGLSIIKVLYVVAPLLGLLGTVVGMIETFQMITLFGTGDPRMMAGGISTALVTTVEGLVVAIPLTLLHSFLQGKAKAMIQVLEEQAAGIIARMAESRG